MAVWMQVFGQNTISKELNTIMEYSQETFPKLQLDFSFLENEIKIEPRHRKLRDNYYIYNNKNWHFAFGENYLKNKFVKIRYPFSEEKDGYSDAINILVYNDMIELTGIADHFQNWWHLGENRKVENGYRTLVKEIFLQFGSTIAFYCSEWCIAGEDLDLNFSDILSYVDERSTLRTSKIEGMSANGYFVESLESKLHLTQPRSL